jgi:hypothetical protein
MGVEQAARLFVTFSASNDIEALVKKKLEEMGAEFLAGYLPGTSATSQRINQAIQTGGLSEINRLGETALQNMLPARWYAPLRRRIHGEHSPRSHAAWARTDWATSRQDWLDNKWFHDWRSQPRDARGRWIPGRLQWINDELKYPGTRPGRRKLKKLRARRLGRRVGRRAARQWLRATKNKYGG